MRGVLHFIEQDLDEAWIAESLERILERLGWALQWSADVDADDLIQF